MALSRSEITRNSDARNGRRKKGLTMKLESAARLATLAKQHGLSQLQLIEKMIRGRFTMKYLKYKNYSGTIETDLENNLLFGKIAFIRDLITYEAKTLKELDKEFRLSLDIYLQDCNKTLEKEINSRI